MKTLLLEKHFRRGLLGGLLLLLFYACQKNELRLEQFLESTASQIVFDQSDFNNLIGYDYVVDLSNPKKLYSDDLESFYYEFEVNYISLLNPEALNALQQRGAIIPNIPY